MKKGVTHVPSVAEAYKTTPPYVENDSPVLPLGHGVFGVHFGTWVISLMGWKDCLQYIASQMSGHGSVGDNT